MVGIYPGVVALNPDIVKVENIVEGSTTYVYIQGRNVGETSLEYTAVRRNTEGYGKDEAPDLGECRQCFKVKVIK